MAIGIALCSGAVNPFAFDRTFERALDRDLRQSAICTNQLARLA